MGKRLNNRWVVAGAVVLIGAVAFWYFVVRPNLNQTLERQQAANFAEAKCPDDLLNELEKGAGPSDYESLGACYVYRSENDKAADNYQKAKEGYEAAGNSSKATEMTNVLNVLRPAEIDQEILDLLHRNDNENTEGGQ